MTFVNLFGLNHVLIFHGGSQLLGDGISDPLTFEADDLNELLTCLSKLPEDPLQRNAADPSDTIKPV